MQGAGITVGQNKQEKGVPTEKGSGKSYRLEQFPNRS